MRGINADTTPAPHQRIDPACTRTRNSPFVDGPACQNALASSQSSYSARSRQHSLRVHASPRSRDPSTTTHPAPDTLQSSRSGIRTSKTSTRSTDSRDGPLALARVAAEDCHHLVRSLGGHLRHPLKIGRQLGELPDIPSTERAISARRVLLQRQPAVAARGREQLEGLFAVAVGGARPSGRNSGVRRTVLISVHLAGC